MIELTVCIGTSCHQRGAEKVIKIFKNLIAANNADVKVSLKGNFCMGKCSESRVQVRVNDVSYDTNPEEAKLFFLNIVMNKVGTK